MLSCTNCGCLTEITQQQQQNHYHHHYQQQQQQMNDMTSLQILCLKCEQIFVQLQQLNISGIDDSSNITTTSKKNLSCSINTSVPPKPQFRFMQSPVDIPQQELQAFYYMNQSPLVTPGSPTTTTTETSSSAFSSEQNISHSQFASSFSPNRSEVISRESSSSPPPYGNDIDYGHSQQRKTTTTTNNSNDNSSMMMTDDEDFEYGDELNFLINKFDLKEQKKNTFMPYIF